jgi:lysine 6-dehydrogenase
MGPAVAADALADATLARVTLADREPAALDRARRELARRPGAARLELAHLDLADGAAARTEARRHDVIVDALPPRASALAVRAAVEAARPLVTLSGRGLEAGAPPAAEAARRGVLVVLGCGLEPGLTEIVARRLAEGLDRVDAVHIKCGGIPERPAPPLGYKIVFGGDELPLRAAPAAAVVNGQVVALPRYSGLETVRVRGVGTLEAWHDGFATSLLALPRFRRLRSGTQKTLRWPGYAARATVLRELGLLETAPVLVDGVAVRPKRLVDAVLLPRVRLGAGERDLVVLRVDAHGPRGGRPRHLRAALVDRARDGFTAMARTTGFTASIVARMIARGEIRGAGVQPPEALVSGAALDRLLAQLAARGIRVEFGERRPRVPAAPPRRAGRARRGSVRDLRRAPRGTVDAKRSHTRLATALSPRIW